MSDCLLLQNKIPENDRFLIRRIGVSFQDLVSSDYREIWDKFLKANLTKNETKRLKHIRKREKNKLYEKEKNTKYESTMDRLMSQRSDLVSERSRLLAEIQSLKNKIQYE